MRRDAAAACPFRPVMVREPGEISLHPQGLRAAAARLSSAADRRDGGSHPHQQATAARPRRPLLLDGCLEARIDLALRAPRLGTCTKTRIGRFRWLAGLAHGPAGVEGPKKVRPAISKRQSSLLAIAPSAGWPVPVDDAVEPEDRGMQAIRCLSRSGPSKLCERNRVELGCCSC